MLNNPAPISYNWDHENLLNNDSIYNPSATLTSQTSFFVEVQSRLLVGSDNTTAYVSAIPSAPVITLSAGVLTSDKPSGNQWYNSQGPITGATGQTYQPTVSGYYYATYTSSAGCVSSPSNQIWVEVTDINEPDVPGNFTVYPNPCTDITKMKFNLRSVSSVNVSVFDVLGNNVIQLVNNKSANAGDHVIIYNTKHLKPGTYFIRYSIDEYSGSRILVVQ